MQDFHQVIFFKLNLHLNSTCSCTQDATILNEACTYFADDGVTYPFPPGLSCNNKAGWCGSPKYVSNGRKRIIFACLICSVVCTNEYVCMAAPQAAGQNNFANPTQLNTSDSVQFVPSALLGVLLAAITLLFL